jgi:hypothetical protein
MQITNALSVGMHTVVIGFSDANNSGTTTNIIKVASATQAVQGLLYAFSSFAINMVSF